MLLLHLSDLHFGNKNRFANMDADQLGKGFHRSLEGALNEPDAGKERIDVVIVTGDIAEQGLPREFKYGGEFFRALATALGLPKERFVFLPGNHDISWPDCEMVRAQLNGEKIRPEEFESRLNLAKLENYRAFLKSFYGADVTDFQLANLKGAQPLGYDGWLRDFSELRLSIAALNTSERENDEIKGGDLSDHQAQALMDKWRMEPWTDYLKIIAVHHNPISTTPENIKGTIDVIREKLCNTRDAAMTISAFEHYVRDLAGFKGGHLLQNIVRDTFAHVVLHGHHHDQGNPISWHWRKSGHAPVLSVGSFGLSDGQLPIGAAPSCQLLRFVLSPDKKVPKLLALPLIYDGRFRLEGQVLAGAFRYDKESRAAYDQPITLPSNWPDEANETEGECPRGTALGEDELRSRLVNRNDSYLRSVQGQLINKASIPRSEVRAAYNLIVDGDKKFGAFIGIAGMGKSCATAELIEMLRGGDIAHFALRLDVQYNVHTTRQLGNALDLPQSPVSVLADVAKGRPSVLVIDQLDAISVLSGRNLQSWQLAEDLIAETHNYPNLKVWLICREFDLEHDPKLRAMFEREKAQKILLQRFSNEIVLAEIKKAGIDSSLLTTAQIELLSTPIHLSLFLEGAPKNQAPFKSVNDLYRRYWNHKLDRVKTLLNREPKWTEVIDVLCDKSSEEQTLAAVSVDYLDDLYHHDAHALCSENVLIKVDDRYRFFHEGFFDYAFARRFVGRGKSLIQFLLQGGEQHLFRRSQVRQILTYLRDEDQKKYLSELRAILHTDGIRSHIVKMVLDWLGAITNPSREELACLDLA